MIDKSIRYEDQRLTKKQKKKIKPVKQAGVMNYMPSKMVTVPKIAKSSPDTPTAKLAYITPEEEKILIDLNLYGSLNGKPNRGPGGIPSLEGDFGPGGKGNYSGGSGDEKAGGGSGGGGRQDTESQYGGDYGYDSSQNQSGREQQYGGNDDVTYKGPAELGVTTRTENTIDMPEPERDTGLERARQANIALADQLSKYTPPPVNLPTLGPFSFLTNTLLQGPLDAFNKFTAEKNIDFFQENVAGKYGYGYGIEDYEQYMDDRMSGKVGAYGNENMGQNAINERSGGDNRQDISGILEALIQPVEEPEVLPKGFTYTPYSNQVVIAPGSQGLASLTGGQGFLQNII